MEKDGAQRALVTSSRAWLRTSKFATLLGVSPQTARSALKLAAAGGEWRGQKLEVRRLFGRGGRGGLSYEVAADTLKNLISPVPTEVAVGFEIVGSGSAKRRIAGQQGAVVEGRWSVLKSILAIPVGSEDRAAAVANAAVASGCSVRTIYRWIKSYEENGLRGLGRIRSPTASARRVIVSREFDRAMRGAGIADETLQEIALELHASLRGLWASRAEQAGVNEIRRLAEFLLLESCEKREIAVSREAVRLSRRCVERFSQYRVVNQRKNDRKTFDDGKPRIRRDWTGLQPMERVIADAKHLDVIVRRADGSLAWPKIIGFMDGGTGRIFIHPVLLDPGDGIRQDHVIEGFLAMVADPYWGFPQSLYLDNGSEFAALIKIDAALNALNEPGARTVIFAKPYNAAAKPVESLFARLDRYVFSMLPGYAGPNRLAKKTQTLGKPPEPFPGSWDTFCSTVQRLVGAYHHQPVGGQWANRSPNAWYEEKVATGWRPSSVDLMSLDAAFCGHDSRRLDRGMLKINGKRFSHPEITKLPNRTVVDLALPWRRDAAPLARAPGGEWCRLTVDVPYPAQWVSGAKETSKRQGTQSRHVAALAKEAPSIDPVATKIRWSESQDSAAPPRANVPLDMGEQLIGLGGALLQGAGEITETSSPAQLRHAREMAITERLERALERDD